MRARSISSSRRCPSSDSAIIPTPATISPGWMPWRRNATYAAGTSTPTVDIVTTGSLSRMNQGKQEAQLNSLTGRSPGMVGSSGGPAGTSRTRRDYERKGAGCGRNSRASRFGAIATEHGHRFAGHLT